jgi:ATP-dependent helicase/nuclease subunit A
LFRALSDVQHYEEALRRYEIDYYLVGGHAFYAQQEIYDLLNLLRAVASPSDEVSLAGVLRSPMFSLEDETLFWLAKHADGLRGGLLAEQPPAELNSSQGLRVQFAAGVLGELRRQKDCLPVAELIQLALDRTGYDAVLVAEFMGQRKLANLRKLIDQARSVNRFEGFSLGDFITQLAEFVSRQPDEPLAATNPESTDVVRLMTVHQSKGLEFPIVVVPDVDRRMQGPSSPIAFSRELGPLVKTSGPGGYELHAMASKEEELAEIIRLLYVATTRAADRLILAGGVPELGATSGSWTELLGRRFDLLTGQLRAALPEGYPAPKIQVLTSEPPLARQAISSRSRRDLDKLIENAREVTAGEKPLVLPWLQPIPPDGRARRQYSFSQLTGRLRVEEPETTGEPERSEPPVERVREASSFGLSQSVEVNPLDLGTLVHAVLAEVDFQHPDEVEALTRRHAPWHLPGMGDGLDDAIRLVRRFLQSPRAQSVATAREVYRELDFLLAWPPGTQDPEPRFVQGAIDCLYLDAAGGWRLLDYKTHRVSESQVASAAAHYEIQLLLYGLAVEQLFGCPPDELVLCFLHPGVEHRVAWSESARQRVVLEVNRSIAAMSS